MHILYFKIKYSSEKLLFSDLKNTRPQLSLEKNQCHCYLGSFLAPIECISYA
eukprot:UN21216